MTNSTKQKVEEIRSGVRDVIARTLVEQSHYAGGAPVPAQDMEPAIAFRLGQYLGNSRKKADVRKALQGLDLAAGKEALAATLDQFGPKRKSMKLEN